MIERACVKCGTVSDQAHCPEHRQPIRSPSSKRTGRRDWRRTRARILTRDNHRCHYCHGPADQVDHIVSVSQGGTDDDHNLAAACGTCNARKGGR